MYDRYKNKLLSTVTAVMLILFILAITNNFKDSSVAAQKASSVETFSAGGYTGQTFVLPNFVPITHHV
jgi:hypothetical protein